jgi:hypothetical protein
MIDKPVIFYDMSPSRMLEIVSELKTFGLVVDKDFTFAYTPVGQWTFESYAPKKFVTFKFKEEKILTWFFLKFS